MAKMDIRVVETSQQSLEGYTLVEGFPGMGLVGTIAAKYLVEKLEVKEIGHIHSESFVPIIRIHNGMPVRPSRIFVSEKNKLVILISEQIIPKQHTQAVSEAVVDWIRDRKIKRIISLSGIGIEGTGKELKLYGIASNEASKKLLKENSIQPIQEGITTGVIALILLDLKDDESVEAISLLASIKSGADYTAAAELLKKLNLMLGLEINVEPLVKEARETEKALVKQLEKLKQTHETVRKIEDQTPMYA
ncbi:MAG: proteasome assembly chaperone family protein [Candidatus Diapherotrites archaeon]|uniref:Proteasome assembly chaperone family protein n=2 Tax=Candidatus Iainarchaeum sp. TaxID=3101447 RepID=A0A8T4KS74_9ARCH|nr:proteasome assembly chaperone family protein [Candidatus Diapherotrites archaeon]